MTNVATLPVDQSKAREHVTLPIEELARRLALAYSLGYRNGVSDADLDAPRHAHLLCAQLLTIETRVDLYAAQLSAEARGAVHDPV